MKVSLLTSPVAIHRCSLPLDSQGPTACPQDQIEVASSPPRGWDSKSLLRIGKWAVLGAACGALPFILGAKAGGLVSMLAAGGLVDSLSENRRSLGEHLGYLASTRQPLASPGRQSE